MTVIALVKQGRFERRLRAARHALKSWDYRLVKSRASVADADQANAFSVADMKSGRVVAGGSVEKPELSLSQVEDWYNAQGFVAKIASDGTRLRDVSPEAMSAGQREVLDSISLLPEPERLELVRYLSAQLLERKREDN